jgi:hypothetical protein
MRNWQLSCLFICFSLVGFSFFFSSAFGQMNPFELTSPMRGNVGTQYDSSLYIKANFFDNIAVILKKNQIEGLSVSACSELFNKSEEAIKFGAVTESAALISELNMIIDTSAKITNSEGRKIIFLWDIRRATLKLFPCPFPWCTPPKK